MHDFHVTQFGTSDWLAGHTNVHVMPCPSSDQVMDMMCSCLSRTSGYALAMMQKFTQILPRNPVLIAR